MSRKEDVCVPALQKTKVPILTLDHKWHKLFSAADATPEILALEEELNELLKRQGKLNTESKEIKKLKMKLMEEIVPMVNELEQHPSSSLEKKIETNKRLINECNEKLESYQDELLDLPRDIDKVNYELMLQTMEVCYEKLQENTADIEETSEWVNQVRVELKKRMVRKMEKEQQNHELYSYMHAIFGADVIDIFDMKYNPEEWAAKQAMKLAAKKQAQEAVSTSEQHNSTNKDLTN